MGSAKPENAGQCGLHYDALDNFHVLLSGRKKWKIYSPADALNLDYVLPTLNVSADGDILQCVRVHHGWWCIARACVRACVRARVRARAPARVRACVREFGH